MKAAEITKEEKYVAPEVELIPLSLESGVLSPNPNEQVDPCSGGDTNIPWNNN